MYLTSYVVAFGVGVAGFFLYVFYMVRLVPFVQRISQMLGVSAYGPGGLLFFVGSSASQQVVLLDGA